MKIAIDETITLEFDSWTLEEAAKRLEEIKAKHREGAEDILNGILTLLLFCQIEKSVPGTVERLSEAASAASGAALKL